MTPAPLPTTEFGRTGFEVTRLGYGAMELRQGGLDPSAVGSVLNLALDLGINLIDTSPDYGASETLIGEVLSGRRDEFFLASKCGCPIDQPKVDGRPPAHDYTRANVRAGVEQSLRRLRTDHLDLVQFHGSPSRSTLEHEGALDELSALRSAGKIRFLGMSAQLPDLRDHLALGVFDAFQIPYSAIERDHEEVLAAASAAGAATIVRGAVARGALADRPDRPPESLRPVTQQGLVLWDERNVDELLDGASRTEFLVRFAISNPTVDCAIVGSVDPTHLADNVAAAAKGPLPPDVYDEARRRLDAKTGQTASLVGSGGGAGNGQDGRGHPGPARRLAHHLRGLVSWVARPDESPEA